MCESNIFFNQLPKENNSVRKDVWKLLGTARCSGAGGAKIILQMQTWPFLSGLTERDEW